MNKAMTWLYGLGLGAVLMYIFDPDRGRRRRALMRDQVDIQMSYNPPVGVVGHAIASFFGSNPKQAMDEDLVRFKSLIEQGKTTTDGQTVRPERVRNKQQKLPA